MERKGDSMYPEIKAIVFEAAVAISPEVEVLPNISRETLKKRIRYRLAMQVANAIVEENTYFREDKITLGQQMSVRCFVMTEEDLNDLRIKIQSFSGTPTSFPRNEVRKEMFTGR